MVSKLVYIGNLGEGYDLETVITAVNETPSLTLSIAGYGPKEKALKAMAGERVRFFGYLEAEALKELLAHCEVGVIPMRDDSWVGLPYKLGDYLAAGLEIVSSLKGECGELLRREGFGAVYEFGSVKSFLGALKLLNGRHTHLPDLLMAEKIYDEYVGFITEGMKNRR